MSETKWTLTHEQKLVRAWQEWQQTWAMDAPALYQSRWQKFFGLMEDLRKRLERGEQPGAEPGTCAESTQAAKGADDAPKG